MASPALPYSSRRSSPPDGDSMIGNFKKMESIGKGSFAMVYRGVHVKTRTLVAIKSVQLNKLNKKLKENLQAEIKILRSLHHPHIVALIDCQESAVHMHLVMEFCELGDLSAFIKKRATLSEHPATAAMISKYPNPQTGGLNEVIVRHFAKQIASAIEFLRAKNYIHRDLKPQNLLLNPPPLFYQRHPEVKPFAVDANSLVPAAGIESLPMLKVADFGFARVLPQTSLAETLCGSPLYMAPEILRYEKYDAKADLWSVGTVLHEMMVAKPPFRAQNHVELLRRIEKQDDRIKFPEGLLITDEMKSLIRGLLKRKPAERISYEQFFGHPVISRDIPGLVGDDRGSAPSSEAQLATITSRTLDQANFPEESCRSPSNPYSQSPRDSAAVGNAPSPRPTSRPSLPRRDSQTPPRATPVRRPGPEQPQAAQRDRRPALTNHATAPSRPASAQERSAALALERRRSQRHPEPSTVAVPREQLDRERAPRRAEEAAARDSRERAAQDIAFEREYVVVEKKTVEINAFADELAASPYAYRERPSSPHHAAMVRRATTQGSPTSVTGATTQSSRAIQIVNRGRADTLHQRTGSYERRYGPSLNSASSALSKAMNMVTMRGFNISPPYGKGPSPPQGYAGFPAYPMQSSLVVVNDGSKAASSGSKDEDSRTLAIVEELAQRSHVVFGFAEVKYRQLLPAPPSDQGLGIGGADKAQADSSAPEEEDDLTLDAVLTISEEALVLYVKSLDILSKAMDITAAWWSRQQKPDAEAPSIRSSSPIGNQVQIKNRMVNVVQWVRSRFNDCCDKAQFVAHKLVESQRRLPLDHPSHPNNQPSSSGSATSIGSAENIYLTSGVTAEKIMYDRAIEMSRTAAVNELVNEDLPGCEVNYATAIRMLEAIVGADENELSDGLLKKESRNDDVINGLEDEDMQSVLKLIESMKSRLKALRKKIEVQKLQKRASIVSFPASHTPSTRPSPSTTPR